MKSDEFDVGAVGVFGGDDAEAGNVARKASRKVSASLLEDMRREVAASERRYQQFSRGMVHHRNGDAAITEEMDAPRLVARMEAVARRITKGDEAAIKVVTGKGLHTYGHFRHTLTSLGKAILAVCFEAVPMIEMAYPGCRRETHHLADKERPYTLDDPYRMDDLRVKFNPYLTVMLHACQKARPVLISNGCKQLDVDDPEVIRTLDVLLRSVRRLCRSRMFKRLQANYARCAKENFRSCCHYMATKFAQHSKLLILRVDLYITPEHKAWATTEAANRCVHRFLRAVRESRVVPDVKGWICARENGFRRGVHLHLLVAMDGHKHRQAGTYSRQLGEAWKHDYSDGHGSYFNCWVRRGQYALNCLGLVHVSDHMMLLGLSEAIRYITKSDFQVDTGYARNLWKGTTPTSWNVVKRGAPRKAKHDLALVNEILGSV